MAELLAQEAGLREELATRAAQDREEAGNSARESRAASAMMVVREEARAPSESWWNFSVYMYYGMWFAFIVMPSLEEHIVQACLLDNLVPSPSFQLAVCQVCVFYSKWWVCMYICILPIVFCTL